MLLVRGLQPGRPQTPPRSVRFRAAPLTVSPVRSAPAQPAAHRRRPQRHWPPTRARNPPRTRPAAASRPPGQPATPCPRREIRRRNCRTCFGSPTWGTRRHHRNRRRRTGSPETPETHPPSPATTSTLKAEQVLSGLVDHQASIDPVRARPVLVVRHLVHLPKVLFPDLISGSLVQAGQGLIHQHPSIRLFLTLLLV